jgi:hypothetical protein
MAALIMAQGTLVLSSESNGVSGGGRVPLSFVPNRGQNDEAVAYEARTAGTRFQFMGDRAVIALARGDKGHRLDLRFLGANPDPAIVPSRRLEGRVNYLRGADRSRWQTNLPTYGAITYRDLWPGIDLTFKSTSSALKYEFLVRRGADPSRIRLAYAGAQSLSLTSGALQVKTAAGTMRDAAPRSFQRGGGGRTAVSSRYSLGSNFSYGFVLGRYDRSRPLVIDPGLAYSTFLGGSGSEYSQDVAVDGQGNSYVTGDTESSNFPTTAGAFDPTYDFLDAFVTKLSPTGSLLYSTYLGGSGYEFNENIAVEGNGSAYIAGQTYSSDFPTTPGAFDTTLNVDQEEQPADVYVAKLAPSGSALVYSTYLGGTYPDFDVPQGGVDAPTGIALDAQGSAFVTGWSRSANFPTTAGAYDRSGAGGLFVTKFNPSGSALEYSTFFGGNGGPHFSSGIALDEDGNAYVTGQTTFSGFTTTLGAFDTTHNGGVDGFVTELNSTGSGLVYSTFLGGSATDSGNDIALDASHNAYVTGGTGSMNFPTTAGAYATAGGGAFVSKLNPAGSALAYSTFVGPGAGTGIAVDVTGNAYMSATASSGFPTTADAVDPTYGGNGDGAISKLNATGSGLLYSSYLGGASIDHANAVGVDQQGNPTVVGDTQSLDFTTTPGAPDQTFAGFNEAFAVRYALSPPYDHPESASPLEFSLVPELRQTISSGQCQARGGTPSAHGAPLAFLSCNPPAYAPGTAARFRGRGSADLTVLPGDLTTPADEADVAISASLTDVRAAAGGDYSPSAIGPDLTLVARLRISDSFNGPASSDPGTAADLEFPVPVDCVATADPAAGSDCGATTSFDAVSPGSIGEHRAAVLQAFRVRVNDSGPNAIRGDGDDRRLASQGIYVP